ncbi:MAG: DNA-dependent RNA polymerase auxiliary subunit epsilon family protein [Aerococcus sp.]|nr:DNA-dependent RNA polymerase auxiliary subunit epsilon family protein [Aerococcus sp.]
MIFKVLYQENANEPAIRENTQALYIEGDNIRDVRKKVSTHSDVLIENIFPLDDAHLAYEKQSEAFQLTEYDD